MIFLMKKPTNKCSNCENFRVGKESSCSSNGVKPNQDCCEHFVIGVSAFSLKKKTHLAVLAAIAQLDTSELVSFGELAFQEVKTRKTGFKCNDVVYFLTHGDDCVDNYSEGRVITANNTHVSVITKAGFTATLHHSSVYRIDAWESKKSKLVKAGKLKAEPQKKKYNKEPPVFPESLSEPETQTKKTVRL